MKVRKSVIFYRLYVLLFMLSTFPALSILLGLKLFCNESFYSVYLGAYTVCNIYLPITEGLTLILFLIYTILLNKDIMASTFPFDKNLEENETVTRYYNKYNLEYYYLIPIALQGVVGFLSHIEVFKECSTGLFLIIVLGIIQLIFGVVILYNYIQYIIFLEEKDLYGRKKSHN